MRKILNLILGMFIVLITIGMSHAEETTNTVTTLPLSPKITPLQLSIWNPVQLTPENWDVWGLRLNLPYGKNHRVYGIDAGFVNSSTHGGVAIQAGVIANICDTNSFEKRKPRDTDMLGGGMMLGDMPEDMLGDMVGAQLSPILNWSDNFVGVQAGFMNLVKGKGNAIQVGFMNVIGLDGNAIQVGFGNMIGSGGTVQIGVMNIAMGKDDRQIVGLQIGGIENLVGKMTGLQFGGALFGGNGAGTMNGIQIGLAPLPTSITTEIHRFCNNAADELNGVQIGLWSNRAKTARGLQIALVNITEKMTGVQIGLVNIIKSSPVPFFPVINVHF